MTVLTMDDSTSTSVNSRQDVLEDQDRAAANNVHRDGINNRYMDLPYPTERTNHFDHPAQPNETSITRRLLAKKLIEDSLQDHQGVLRLRVERLNNDSLAVSPLNIKIELDKQQMQRNKLNKRRALIFYHLARFHHKFGIRHIFLVALLAAYSVLGGVMFMNLEHNHEVTALHENREILTELMANLTVEIFEIANVSLTPDMSAEAMLLIRAFYTEMIKTEDKYIGSVFHKFENIYENLTWNYATAIFYAMTLFTTIGYGTIACQTAAGKAITVIYATIGIPLMLVVLSDIGRLLLKWLTRAYNAYLRFYWKMRKTGAKSLLVFWRFSRQDPESHQNHESQQDQESQQEIKTAEFPLELAVALTSGYLMLCALVVEYFDYEYGLLDGLSFGDSFYFAFISMSTIGLGDVMPNNIAYSPYMALMFLLGLSLVSVVNSTVYARMERKFLNAVENVENVLERLHVHRHGSEGYEVMRNLGPSIQLLVVALPLFDDVDQQEMHQLLESSEILRIQRDRPRRAAPVLGVFGFMPYRPSRQRSSTITVCDCKRRSIRQHVSAIAVCNNDEHRSTDEFAEAPMQRPGTGKQVRRAFSDRGRAVAIAMQPPLQHSTDRTCL